MPPLTDRQRIELGIPCWLWAALVHAVGWQPDPGLAEAEGKEKLKGELPRLKALLNQACDEAIDDLPEKRRRQMNNRITRVAGACSLGLDKQDGVKISLALYYFTKSLLDSGALELWEGSAMGEAMEILFPAYSQGFAEERLNASAHKQARHVLRNLQAAGFYQGVAPAELAAA